MISICIPVYNFNVTPLVAELHRLSEKESEPIEIVIIDDASDIAYKEAHRKLTFSNVKYFELPQNVGRAKIRNLFLEHCNYNYLLFLDCDSLINQPLFIKNYIASITTNTQVVCGGRVYPDVCPSENQKLSWTYGIYRESKPLEERQKKPFNSFMTNNFLIEKSVLEHHKLDERINGYGHEDTLLGFTLQQNNIQVLHINNPVLNGDIEENDVFLNKTERGVKNLVEVLRIVNYNPDFIQSVSLLRFYFKIKNLGLHHLITLTFPLFKPIIKKLLMSGTIQLNLFDLYKLGFLTIQFNSKK